MSVPVKSLSVSLNRNVAPCAWESFAGAPISITGTLPTDQDFTGITAIRAELHATTDSSETPLAVSDDLEELPTGRAVVLTFSTDKMNRLAGRYYISIFATYPDDRVEPFRVCELRIIDSAVSQLTPPAPAPALYATTAAMTAESAARAAGDTAEANARAAAITAEAVARAAADTSEAAARAAADAALTSRIAALETITDLNARLKGIVSGEGYELTSITRDSDGVTTSAVVLWPDGTAGVFTTVTKNTTWLTIDAFTITYLGSVTKTITQAAVTRDSSGAVTVKPALTITP